MSGGGDGGGDGDGNVVQATMGVIGDWVDGCLECEQHRHRSHAPLPHHVSVSQ